MRTAPVLCLFTALALTFSGCAATQEGPAGHPSASASIAASLAEHDGRVYVYRDCADGWNFFTQRSWLGSHGVKPSDMQQDYAGDAYSGGTSIRCAMNFGKTDWGGYMCLNGTLAPGETEPVSAFGETDAAVDLSGASSLTFYAKGRDGGERVEFFCAGLGYNEFGPSEPYADSAPKQTLGTVTLTKDWREYSIDLTAADMRYIGNGFAWVATAAENRDREQIEFYLDEIFYLIPDRAPSKAFLVSYGSPVQDTSTLVLNNCAYLNDNAAACIALRRSGETGRARQIADAIDFALDNDRFYTDGRLRNGYLCGPLESHPGWYSPRGIPYAMLPGFQYPLTQKWHEDFHMVSTDAGSMAWAVLALCELAGENSGYAAAADRIGRFLLTLEDAEVGGFAAGYLGWEGTAVQAGAVPAGAVNTQFNLELAAAFGRLRELTGDDAYRAAREEALRSALAFYSPGAGYFRPGAFTDSGTALTNTVLLSTNATAALALPDECAEQRVNALAYVEENLTAGEGFASGASDRSGVWLYGTAVMAAAYRWGGDAQRAAELLAYLEDNLDQDGMLYASNKDGLLAGWHNFSDNQPVAFYHRGHLGSTAWLAFAQGGENPLEWVD